MIRFELRVKCVCITKEVITTTRDTHTHIKLKEKIKRRKVNEFVTWKNLGLQ